MKLDVKFLHQGAALIAMLTTLSSFASSRGFNRTSLRSDLADKTPVVTDAEIQKTLALKPQLPKPFKLGVYFKEPEGSIGSRWNWGEGNKQKIFSILEQVKSKAQISEVISVSPSTVTGKGTDLKALRLAAAEHGADALLGVSGVKGNDTYTNGGAGLTSHE